MTSDIHSEFWLENAAKAKKLVDMRLPPMLEDNNTVLLLAGDTGSHRRRGIYRVLIEHLCKRFRLVLDMPGNHFWYGGSDWDRCDAPTSAPNYIFGSTFKAGPVVGATLWADFQRENPVVEEQCRVGMNDFRQIPGLTPGLVKARHCEHLAFLRENMEPGGIVMTHFAPSWQSISPEYGTSEVNGYYASDLEDLILEKRPALWVHGHIHSWSDYMVGETHVLCNPAGYEGRDHDPLLRFEWR